jgi:hypothetical protein
MPRLCIPLTLPASLEQTSVEQTLAYARGSLLKAAIVFADRLVGEIVLWGSGFFALGTKPGRFSHRVERGLALRSMRHL